MKTKQRKLFSQWCPATYWLAVQKGIVQRHWHHFRHRATFAHNKQEQSLPVTVYQSNSLIRRKLGNVDQQLQENKAINLAIAAPHINGVLIHPGETFSFWHLVGNTTKRKGYRDGLVIDFDQVSKGIAGGMCQLTNLIHWLVLHSPLDITEHHHHDQIDLFPDYGRTVPFGTGTSIMYNYLDYQFTNNTEHVFQLIIYVTDTYLCGELRCDEPLPFIYHIEALDEHFVREGDTVFRNGTVIRRVHDRKTGNLVSCDTIKQNHARVLYDTSHLQIRTKS